MSFFILVHFEHFGIRIDEDEEVGVCFLVRCLVDEEEVDQSFEGVFFLEEGHEVVHSHDVIEVVHVAVDE